MRLSKQISVFLAIFTGLILALQSLTAQQPPAPFVLADWHSFRDRFISPRGRVVDTGNEYITHSEGQGYAMLFAVAFNDRKTFENLLTWTMEHLGKREDSLFAWRWRPTPYGGFIDDPNNASDGDILIAWALLRAGDKWGNTAYLEQAEKIIRDIERTVLLQNEGVLLLIPGEHGFVHTDRIVLNLSYYVFPALKEFARRDTRKKSPWDKVIEDGLTMLERARFGKEQLPTDWVDYAYGLAPAAERDPVFGYDAIRIPLYLGWAAPRARQLEPFNRYFNGPVFSRNPQDKVVLTSAENNIALNPASDGMKAIALVTTRLYTGRPVSPREFPSVARQSDYYSACLILLSKLAIADQEQPTRLRTTYR